MRSFWTMTAVSVATVLAVLAPACAQPATSGVDVTVPAPARPEPELRLEPAAPTEQTGVREQGFHPGPTRSEHNPAFVQPFVLTAPVSRTSAVRLGVSAWTPPALPGLSEGPAGTGAALGLTIQWGVPLPGGSPTLPKVDR